jgi:hypothetical protein
VYDRYTPVRLPVKLPGVAPWTWADKRLSCLASRWVGQHADELDERLARVPAGPGRPGREAAPLDVLDGAGDPMCRLLRRAFEAARVSERDRSLLPEMELQRSLGDPRRPRPSARCTGSPPPPCQAVKRAKDRLRRVTEATSGFEPLRDIALLA